MNEKNAIESDSKMYQGEKRICEFGDRPFVIIQSEEEKVKNMEKCEGSLCELWDSSK